jgi:hypothetical protein
MALVAVFGGLGAGGSLGLVEDLVVVFSAALGRLWQRR